MELLKKNIHMSRRKAYGENRMTLSEDFNIPDKKPDAAGLIQKRGEVKLEEVRTTEGQVQLSGTLEVHILYVSEGDERRLCRQGTIICAPCNGGIPSGSTGLQP